MIIYLKKYYKILFLILFGLILGFLLNINNFFDIFANSLYLKEFKIENSLSSKIETIDFKDNLNSFKAPQHLKIFGSGKKISLSVLPEQKKLMSGVLYILDDSLFRKHRDIGNKRIYIFQLKKEIYDELSKKYEVKKDIKWESEDIKIRENKIKILPNSTVRIEPFDSDKIEVFLEYNQSYILRSNWILINGSLGNSSVNEIIINSQSQDISPPLIVESLTEQGYLYKKNYITLNTFYDLENGKSTLMWDKDRDGTYETITDTYETNIYRIPTIETIPFAVKDIAENIAQNTVEMTYISPKIELSIALLSKIEGFISPRYEGVPITLLRERFGITKKISSTINTDTSGNYKFDTSKMDLSKNALVKDKNGKIIAEINANNGIMIPKDNEYSVELIVGNEKLPLHQVLLNKDRIVVANNIIKTNEKFSVQEKDNFSEILTGGTFVKDINKNDNYIFDSFEIDAPENAGGMLLYNKSSGDPYVMIYKSGNIRFFKNLNNWKIRQKEDNKFIVEIINNKKIIAEVLLNLTKKNIKIDFDLSSSEKISFLNKYSKYIASQNNIDITNFPFKDISIADKYYKAIKSLYEKNMISGYTDNTFRPNKKISRAEFVHLALAVTDCLDCMKPSDFEKEKYYQPNLFPDISIKDWFNFCISKAKKLNMINGYGDGLFKPNQSITRAEAVAILLRQSGFNLDYKKIQNVGDVSPSAWYYEVIMKAIEVGLITPYNGFVFPDEEITRGEFAIMSENLFKIRDCREIDSDKDGIYDYLEKYNGTDPFNNNDKNNYANSENSNFNPRDEILSPIPLDNNQSENGNNNGNSNDGNSGNNNGNSNDGNSGNNNGNSNDGNLGNNNGNSNDGNSGNNNGNSTDGNSGNNNGNSNDGNSGNNNGNSNDGNLGNNNGNSNDGNSGNNNGNSTDGNSGNNNGNSNDGNLGNNNGNSNDGNSGNNNGNSTDGNSGNNNGNSNDGNLGNNNGNSNDGNLGNNNGNSNDGNSGNNNGNSNDGNYGNNNGNSNDGNSGNNNGNSTDGNSGNNNGNSTDGNLGNNNGNSNDGNLGNNNGNSNDGNSGNNNGNSNDGNYGNNNGNSNDGNYGNNNGNSTDGNSGNNNGNSTDGNSGNNNGNSTDGNSELGGKGGKTNTNSKNDDKKSEDKCKFLPEDIDKYKDEDGCPELNTESSYTNFGQNEVIILFAGNKDICGFLDYKADLRIGDKIWTAILNDKETHLYQESSKFTLK
jgi:hypothetical protein